MLRHSLDRYGIGGLIDHVITNPSGPDPEGRLVIRPYHEQDSCDLSYRNLCKTRAISEHVKSLEAKHGLKVVTVAYCGDGFNDLCPSLGLRDGDLVFARSGYPLENLLAEKKEDVKAKVCLWKTGNDILAELKKLPGGVIIIP